MNLAVTFLFYLFVIVIGFLPFRLLFIFSDFLAFLLMRVFKYRKVVIQENLRRSYPDLGEEEIRRLVKKFYLNLSDITLEGIKAFTMSKKQVVARYKVLNPEILYPYLEAGQGVICTTGHYGNWEWGALSPPLQLPFKFIAFYKPLKNLRFDRFVRKNRSRFGTYLSPIRETTKSFDDNRGLPVIYLMAADQSPSNRQAAYWVNFLGRDTAFLHGPEKHARTNNYPVFFVSIHRVKRGFYELELTLLVEDPSKLANGEITRLYAEKLESIIGKDPSNWLWSHKRWKLAR